MWTEESRRARRHGSVADDQRDGFERDRDRILYSSAFRRLAGITQIVRAGEADVFHTRQQHTLKVAQVGRRIAQLLNQKQGELCAIHGMNPDVVEAACLAHDLGHPPFGHIAEYALQDLMKPQASDDSFEGNAQTFRIVTRLSVRFSDCEGLDLTRATLAAILKYPWYRDPTHPDRKGKWSAYLSENEDFSFAREYFGDSAFKSAEAEVMDFADDIAYSVHDLEDFHKCGMIPWLHILGGDYRKSVLSAAMKNWHNPPTDAKARLNTALRNLTEFMKVTYGDLISKVYEGTIQQRQELRSFTSNLIGKYIGGISLVTAGIGERSVKIDAGAADEIRILKQIARTYIQHSPSLQAQQVGQRKIITDLFQQIYKASRSSRRAPAFLPRRMQELWAFRGQSPARFTVDSITSLTEFEAVALHGRLFGYSSGSVLDPIAR